jgi:hypothetical protein
VGNDEQRRRRGWWVGRRLDLATLPALAGILALGVVAALGTDDGAPAPLVASADGDVTDLADVREAVSPELGGSLSADLAAELRDRVPTTSGDGIEPRGPSAAGEGSGLELVPLDLIVHADEVDLAALDDALDGARHAAAATGLEATGTDEDGDPRELGILGVDEASFRPLVPEITATADAVWERFAEGEVLVTHEVAEELGLELGGTLELRRGDASHTARIGAFAANGAPAVADVLVPAAVAAELGAAGTNTLLVAAGDDPTGLRDTLADATGGRVELRREVAAPVGEERTTTATSSGHIEPFSYTSRADGRITIHGDWVDRNISGVQLPGMAGTSCHRVMIPQLLAAVDELIEGGLYDHLDPAQFAGCFVARHIDWDPSRPLSMHAWGLAIDFNTRDNPLGATPVMDPRVVEVFERWGFDWGGRWSRPDGMHFELARIVPTG